MYRVEKARVMADKLTSLLEKFGPQNEAIAGHSMSPQLAMVGSAQDYDTAPLAEQRRRRVRRNRAAVSEASVKSAWF